MSSRLVMIWSAAPCSCMQALKSLSFSPALFPVYFSSSIHTFDAASAGLPAQTLPTRSAPVEREAFFAESFFLSESPCL